MSNLVKNTICASEGELMAYLYNEMPSESRTQFESHFADCSSCIDAFAEVAVARYSVYEWQQLEFAPLATPAIQIPYEQAARGTSWIASLKEALTLRPQLAFGSAFGVIFVAVVFGYIFLSGSPTNDVAALPDINQPASPVVTPNELNNDTGLATLSGTERAVDQKPEPRLLVTDDRTVRSVSVVQPRSSSTSRRDAGPRQRVRVQPVERIATINATQTAPRLNDFEDMADDSLRLSDLFDDIETSD